jgi:hypothetical protein
VPKFFSYAAIEGGGGVKGLVRIVPEISSFKLIVLLLQLGVVGPYSIHDTCFLSHLPLEETCLYPDLLVRNK